MRLGSTWIGSLVFHVDDESAVSEIALSLTGGGAGIESTPGQLIDPSTITLGAPVRVPEPGTLLLLALGGASALLLGRLRSRS